MVLSVKWNKKWSEECKDELRNNYIGYFDKTTVHGLRYLTEPRRPWPERVLWTIGLSISLVACVWLMYNTYSRWIQTPVIITMDESQRTIWQIPFPAVTICPKAKSYSKEVNYTKLVSMYQKKKLIKKELDDLLKLQMVCNVPIVEDDMGKSIDNTATHVIEQFSLPKNEIICDGSGLETDVEFQSILTEEGVCFTFNMFSSEDFFREGTFHEIQNKYLNYRDANVTWNPVNGYPKNDKKPYPRRPSGLGRRAGLRLFLHTKTKELHPLCSLMGHGFKVILHSPIDYPQIEHEALFVPLDSVFHLLLTPHEMRTDSHLRHSYSPEQRQCYFPDERYLKHFKYYSQRNCELECLANHTLSRCNCVEFYMPRMPDTPVCGWRSKSCVERVKVRLYQKSSFDIDLEENKEESSGELPACQCLQSCTHIWYKSAWTKSEMSLPIKNHFFTRCMDKTEESTNRSILFIYYKDPLFIPIRRVEVFGKTDLLASLGGLMGLCMGISLLSVIEFFYWMLIRPCCQRIKQANPQLRSIKKPLKTEKEAVVQYSRHQNDS